MATKQTKQTKQSKAKPVQHDDIPEGFENVTETFEDGEWVKPSEGTVVKGTLVRAFRFDGDEGPRTAYAIRSGEKLHLLSERAAFASAFRALDIGDMVFLRFDTKEDLISKRTGKPDGRTAWRCTVAVKRNHSGNSVGAALMPKTSRPARAAGPRDDVPPPSDEDVPF